MSTLYDPLRRKDVADTPEERVRQWLIGELGGTLGVPRHLMMSEAGLKFGAKSYRADILIYDRSGAPLAVVECKRPDVALTAAVARQAMRYDIVLSVRWIILSNGGSTLVFRRDGSVFVPYPSIPDYDTMLCLH
ncbi:MAG: type I restriction enzyme HsdR N-terminal domain-containing protein [Bacteroidales bacterium]|nr:type I restriction enzyme HsdR N-terminal domain-containing protein [Bacteroidales bacterium]